MIYETDSIEHRKPTPRQLDTLRVIYNLTEEHGVPPTLREICTALGIASTNGASTHVQALTRRKLLNPTDGRSRTLVITPKGYEVLGVSAVTVQRLKQLARELDGAAGSAKTDSASVNLRLAAVYTRRAMEELASNQEEGSDGHG